MWKKGGGIYTDLGQITAITEVKLQRINLIFRNFTNIVDMHRSDLQEISECSEHQNETEHQAEATHVWRSTLCLEPCLRPGRPPRSVRFPRQMPAAAAPRPSAPSRVTGGGWWRPTRREELRGGDGRVISGDPRWSSRPAEDNEAAARLGTEGSGGRPRDTWRGARRQRSIGKNRI